MDAAANAKNAATAWLAPLKSGGSLTGQGVSAYFAVAGTAEKGFSDRRRLPLKKRISGFSTT